MSPHPTLALALFVLAGLAAPCQAAEPEPQAPSVVEKVEHAIEHGAQAAASGVQRGAKAAARGVERAASATARGVHAAASGVARGASVAARGAETAANKVKGAVSPASSASR
ncbi:MAG: hypothetical protein U1F53_03735 [Burkholderiaceae bacterium]